MTPMQFHHPSSSPPLQGRVLPGTIEDLCSMMTNKTLGGELSRYAAVNSWLLASSNQSSLDVSYSGLIAAMRNTSWEGPAAGGGVCVCVCACVRACVVCQATPPYF